MGLARDEFEITSVVVKHIRLKNPGEDELAEVEATA